MSDMGRRHFLSLADNLRNVRPEPHDHERYMAWRNCVSAVIWTCKKFNPQFDSFKFHDACGVVEVDEPTRNQKIAKAMSLIAEAGPDAKAA